MFKGQFDKQHVICKIQQEALTTDKCSLNLAAKTHQKKKNNCFLPKVKNSTTTNDIAVIITRGLESARVEKNTLS